LCNPVFILSFPIFSRIRPAPPISDSAPERYGPFFAEPNSGRYFSRRHPNLMCNKRVELRPCTISYHESYCLRSRVFPVWIWDVCCKDDCKNSRSRESRRTTIPGLKIRLQVETQMQKNPSAGSLGAWPLTGNNDYDPRRFSTCSEPSSPSRWRESSP